MIAPWGLENSPFQQHEEDLRVGGNVLDCGCAGANLTPHYVAEQMNHIFLSLWGVKLTPIKFKSSLPDFLTSLVNLNLYHDVELPMVIDP